MTDNEKAIKELKEVLDNLDITNEYRLNLIRAIEYLQKEPVKIKKGCKYRSICNVTNNDTGNICFVAGKIYLAPEDDTLVSEENGWLCDTSENASNFELVEEPVSVWHNASEKPERDDLLIETNDGRIIHRQSINNYGMVKRWAYTSALLNLDNSCNLGNNSQEEPVSGLDNGDMPVERWKQAVKAASNQRNYRSSNGLTETRDDYFVDGVQWADENPKEEPVSEDLGEYINKLSKQFLEVSFAKLSRIAVRVAKWQKQQGQSTIELAEDHAYFAGRTKTMDETKEALLSEVLPCFMHGGEADEVVAKLDEVLNKKK